MHQDGPSSVPRPDLGDGVPVGIQMPPICEDDRRIVLVDQGPRANRAVATPEWNSKVRQAIVSDDRSSPLTTVHHALNLRTGTLVRRPNIEPPSALSYVFLSRHVW